LLAGTVALIFDLQEHAVFRKQHGMMSDDLRNNSFQSLIPF
jgi:hypothetical protein